MLDQMESLESIEIPRGYIRDSERVSYYFGNFKFRVIVEIPNINYFRSVTSSKQMVNVLNTKPYNPRASARTYIKDMVSDNLQKITGFVKWREQQESNKDRLRIMISYDRITVYSSDASLLKEFVASVVGFPEGNPPISYHYSNQLADFDKHVIYHKNPKFKYRVFLKAKEYDKESLNVLYQHMQEFGFKISRQMTRHYQRLVINPNVQYMWVWGGLYIDHNEEIELTKFALMHSDDIEKVARIEKLQQ